MERLTIRYDGADRNAHMVCAGACANDDEMCGGCPELDKIVDRLAAYEDTGLTPEEIAKMHTGQIVDNLFDEEFGTPEQRLKAYEDAEEQGLLVRLPCKVGDTVFWADRGINSKEIVELTVDEFSVDKHGPMAVFNRVTPKRHRLCAFYLENFDERIFLTREEAEAALAKEVGNDQL